MSWQDILLYSLKLAAAYGIFCMAAVVSLAIVIEFTSILLAWYLLF